VRVSPWVDLTCSGVSYATKAAADPIVLRESVAEMAAMYAGAGDGKAPLVSPLYRDLRGLPPLLLQVGSDEVLLDEALGLGERAKVAGKDVTVEEWPAMVHYVALVSGDARRRRHGCRHDRPLREESLWQRSLTASC